MIIYKITNQITNKVYIGQTTKTLEQRKAIHLKKARRNLPSKLYRAMREFGVDNFKFEELYVASPGENLDDLEKQYIAQYNSINDGYNAQLAGSNNRMMCADVRDTHLNAMRSEEVRSKISNTLKDYRKRVPFSKEHRQKLSESAVGNTNFGDSRYDCSIACRCVTEAGETYTFKSYRDAWKWWSNVPNVFNSRTECVYQRKIKQSISLGYYTYGRDGVRHMFPKWYKL